MKWVLAAVTVVALVGLGAMIHLGTPPSPRWAVREVDGPGSTHGLCGDRVVVMPRDHGGPYGRVRVLDAATGATQFTALDDGDRWDRVNVWGTYVVATRTSGAVTTLAWVNVATGERRSIERRAELKLWVAPSPRWPGLAVEETPKGHGPRLLFVDADTTVVRHVTEGVDSQAFQPQAFGGRVFFARAGEGAKLLTAWNPATGTVTEVPFGHTADVSPDGRYAVTSEGRECTLWAWGPTPRRVAAVPGAWYHAHYAADGRSVFVCTADGGAGVVRRLDADTGRELWSDRFPERTGAWVWGDRLFLYASGDLEARTLAGGRPLWTMSGARHLMASPDHRTAIVGGPAPQLMLIDTATGRTVGTVPFPFPNPATPRLHADGRQLWVFGRGDPPNVAYTWLTRALSWVRPPSPHLIPSALHGFEWPSMRPLLQLTDRGVNGHSVADDGSFAVTAHNDDGSVILHRWDLPQPRPWVWSVGVPLALGAFLVALWRFWPRRKETP